MNKTIIFLDIDGVLNTPHFAVQAHATWKKTKGRFKTRDKYGMLFDPMSCACLEYLCDITNADVVISSTWRQSGLETMKAMFRERDIDINIIDITPISNSFRGRDIEMWLDKNKGVTNYAILDDHDDFTEKQLKSNFVDCSGKYGFEHNAMAKALKILLERK